MKAPIRYYGGKSLIINKLKEYFPKDFDTYVEPFGGSFSVGLTVDCPNMVYNDLDLNVFALYRVLNDSHLFSIFKQRCDLAVYSENFRQLYKQRLKDHDYENIVDKAFYFFYVNRTSHNGHGGFSINTSIRRNMSKSVSDFLSSIDRLPELHEKLSKVIISNTDGIKLINKFDRNNCFIYLDPPYHRSTRGSAKYDVDMDDNQQEDLIKTVLGVRQAKCLLSGYDCDLYSNLEKSGWNKESFEVKTTDSKMNSKTKIETVWFNYNREK